MIDKIQLSVSILTTQRLITLSSVDQCTQLKYEKTEVIENRLSSVVLPSNSDTNPETEGIR